MKRISIIAGITLLSFCILGCPEKEPTLPELQLIVNNTSNSNILFCDQGIYPDTSLPEIGFNEDNINIYAVNAEISKTFWYSKSRFDTRKKTCFFVYDKDLILKAPWDSIRDNYLILKRYDLSYDDIKMLNWTISY